MRSYVSSRYDPRDTCLFKYFHIECLPRYLFIYIEFSCRSQKGKERRGKKRRRRKEGKTVDSFSLSLSSILATVLTYRCRAHGTRLCEIVTRPGVGENAFRRNPRRMVFGVIFQNNTRVLARGPV